jgi:hypothetical protein
MVVECERAAASRGAPPLWPRPMTARLPGPLNVTENHGSSVAIEPLITSPNTCANGRSNKQLPSALMKAVAAPRTGGSGQVVEQSANQGPVVGVAERAFVMSQRVVDHGRRTSLVDPDCRLLDPIAGCGGEYLRSR